MKPGRELDVRVARDVMGIPVTQFADGTWLAANGEELEPYSTDIAAAWEVVEKMREVDRAVEILFDHGWQANFDSGEYQFGDSAAHAICLAALNAVGG